MQAAAAADVPVFGDDTSRSQQAAQTMRERLDYKPTMSALDVSNTPPASRFLHGLSSQRVLFPG